MGPHGFPAEHRTGFILAHLPQFEEIRGDYWLVGGCKSLRLGAAEQILARKAL